MCEKKDAQIVKEAPSKPKSGKLSGTRPSLTIQGHMDGDNHHIQKFTPEGQFITAVGTEGKGPLQFNLPTELVSILPIRRCM